MESDNIDNGLNPVNGVNWDLIVKYFAGECSDEERKQIDAWVAGDPLRKDQFETLKKVWEASRKKGIEWNVDKAWLAIATKAGILREHGAPTKNKVSIISLPRHDSRFKQIMKIAAAVVVSVGLTYVGITQVTALRQDSELSMREITTEKGQRIRLEFADGTKVMLNSASSIRFPEKFSRDSREVHLRGEAYFEVAHKEDSPFRVVTDQAIVEDIGTEFNVQAWPEERQVKVVVAEGIVALRTQDAAQQGVVLTRGQMSRVTHDGVLTPPMNVDVEKYLGWRDGRLLFENTSFGEALRQVERRNKLICLVADSTLLSRRLTSSFKDESTKEILDIIALSLDLKYSRSGDSVVFRPRESQKREK